MAPGFKKSLVLLLRPLKRLAYGIIPQGVHLHNQSRPGGHQSTIDDRIHPGKRIFSIIPVDKTIVKHMYNSRSPITISLKDLFYGFPVFFPDIKLRIIFRIELKGPDKPEGGI